VVKATGIKTIPILGRDCKNYMQVQPSGKFMMRRTLCNREFKSMMKSLRSAWPYVGRIPGVKAFANSRVGHAIRHEYARHFERRESFTFTQFLRLPTQYDALSGPVIEYVVGPHRKTPLRIVVLGCSIGAEAYSISSVLQIRHPKLDFAIDAHDIDPVVLEMARSAEYDRKWVLGNRVMTPEFVSSTFDEAADRLTVKPAIAARVRFHVSDILDGPALGRIPQADIVYAQNILCNMQRPVAERAFHNICEILAPKSVLFIDGMDLDMRCRLTRRHRLEPLDFELERIHQEARLIRGPRYPDRATGLEPWSETARDHVRRYATIFMRGV